MDTDILIDNKDFLYGGDFLEELSKDYQWSSLLDATDASPSEILADAAPILIPPIGRDISPVLSIKSSQHDSSISDSGSDDDSKNSGSTCARQSSLSPPDWMSSFEDEPSDLKLEDVEEFLQKTLPGNANQIPVEPTTNGRPLERNGPMVAIENGVIKIEGVKLEDDECDQFIKSFFDSPTPNVHKGNGHLRNAYFKVVNENNVREEQPTVINEQIQLVVEQKRVPAILKKTNLIVNNTPGVVVPADSTNGGKIAITPLPHMKTNGVNDKNNIKISSPSNIVISPKPVVINGDTKLSAIQTSVITPTVESDVPISPTLDLSNYSEAEIRAIKKQQRMIKNRESACQSRQKKKEYVTALEQQLLEAHQEIAKLQLENKLLRDQLEGCGRRRKIPRLDASMLIPKKNIAVIFAMIFMVSLNWNVLGWNSKPFIGPTVPQSNTRHLLWTDEKTNIDSAEYNEIPNNRSAYGTDCQNVTSKLNEYANINQTESIRIAGELNRWIEGGKTLNWTNAPRSKRKVYMNDEKINGEFLETYRLFNKLNLDGNLAEFLSTNRNQRNTREKSRLRRLRRSKEIDFSDNAVIDYGALYPKKIRKSRHDFNMDDLGEWNALLDALHRRDDTFYIVGVGKGEHLLLPAVSHNVTTPPKMALILPARNGNDSIMSDHVTLMQIDCSVVNTSLVKLKSDTLPESLRKKSSDHVKQAENTSSEFNTHNYPKRTNKDTIDASLLDILHDSSNNISNYPLSSKKKSPHASLTNGVGKEDHFAQYLLTKYEESKNDSVKSIQGNNRIIEKQYDPKKGT